MKSIQLTQQQKDRLLEMTKELFPEYGEPQLLKSYCATEYDETGSPYLRWYIPFEHNNKKTTKLLEIHWFEFCTIHILEKLYRSNLDLNNFINICYSWNFPEWTILGVRKHPIDYLYDRFKELQIPN